MENNLEQHIVLGVKIIPRFLGHKKWKLQIKYSEKSNKLKFLKQKIN